MSEAETLALGQLAIPICKGIRNDDETLVRECLASLNNEDLVRLYSLVMHEISCDIDIENLEPSVRSEHKRRRLRFVDMYKELQTFRYKWNLLEKQPEGYAKYQSKMSLMGRDPLTYHQWFELQSTLQSGIR